MYKGMNAWKRRKHKMEKASRGPWIEHEHSPREEVEITPDKLTFDQKQSSPTPDPEG